ncbi:uncharacterized protein LOC129743247 [Uranotaenia lowii]|uniref:uncharacterized protein LOC129743247 n=1 Tax=Uranotaenia lowii TaxID=190385 RepID=UPI002478E4B7|nr:uncharacterized protein LOC129743247 [Uranotaenia lowii]
MDPSTNLDNTMCPTTWDEILEKEVPYKEAVGCLTYLAQGTRPDISFAVNQVSQFCSNPGRPHWEAVKKLFKYLKETVSNLSKTAEQDLVGCSDADYGGDPDSRKSTTGNVFTMMGGAVSWKVKRQATVALS